MSKTVTDRLARLLDAEREALLKGDFEAVEALMPEKEALANSFDETNAANLRLLSAALLRNSALLVAAKEGVSTVMTTLKKQRDARMTLSSYDSHGNATKISQPTRGTERRF
ncbi:flagellar protein FlgN [Octadecabacter sp. G9-8]|uniref:Flagellar protein FlgN n=1 Tax=Octadecabacter dasysiphoniae TaxID=2909341 RepID=A0ABS9CWU3_9RHOB|nr:flagellar protein FlgN [Octadecabacter dasysiphoniae]MCF2871618.1 flagellar protein FlgN [Octadecabacter dasysiphoniae]